MSPSARGCRERFLKWTIYYFISPSGVKPARNEKIINSGGGEVSQKTILY